MRPRIRRARSVTTYLLETIPPLFHLFLLTSLTFYSFYFNPSNALWHLSTLFIVGQIVANWVQFLLNRAIILASPKNFPGYVHRFPSLTSSRGRRTLVRIHGYQRLIYFYCCYFPTFTVCSLNQAHRLPDVV